MRYLRKDESGGAVLLQDNQFDMLRQNELNGALQKFGWKNILSENFIPAGEKNKFSLITLAITLKAATKIICIYKDMRKKIQTVYMGGDLENVTVTATRKIF